MGLISVDQLTLGWLFSGFLGMTEVYNLRNIGRINNHSLIPGTKQAGVSNPWTGPVLCHQPSIKREITPILDYRISEGRDMRIWRASRDRSGVWSGRSILGQFWVISGPYSGPNLRKPHGNHWNCLHLAVGRAFGLKYVKYGS